MLNKKYKILLLLLLAFNAVKAQSGTAGALENIGVWINTIGNVVFAIVVIVGLIRVISKFIRGEHDSIGALIQLIIAVALWGGFQLVQDDIANFVGGGERQW